MHVRKIGSEGLPWSDPLSDPLADILDAIAERWADNCGRCWKCLTDHSFMIVCADCGNKRCPRANDHKNACTGSNEVGQEGSAYQNGSGDPSAQRFREFLGKDSDG